MTERWQPVAGWPGYEVSDAGNVRSFWRRQRGANGTVAIDQDRPRQMRPHRTPAGYLNVRLTKAGKTRLVFVHVLVLTAFVCPRPKGADGCHNDGTRDNNHLHNLRWDTRRGNQSDRHRHGTAHVGERHPNARLTWEDVRAIREDASGRSMSALGRAFGVSGSTISRVRSGEIWIDRSGDARQGALL